MKRKLYLLIILVAFAFPIISKSDAYILNIGSGSIYDPVKGFTASAFLWSTYGDGLLVERDQKNFSFMIESSFGGAGNVDILLLANIDMEAICFGGDFDTNYARVSNEWYLTGIYYGNQISNWVTGGNFSHWTYESTIPLLISMEVGKWYYGSMDLWAFTEVKCTNCDAESAYARSQMNINLYLPDEVQQNPSPVPEPATMLLLGSGLIGLAGYRKKFKKS